MRLGVIAALMSLGVAGGGVIAAQKAAGPGSLIARISPAPSTGAAPASAPWTDAAKAPIGELAQVAAAPPARAASAVAFAQNTTAAKLPAAKPLPTCDNPDALGISRVVEIDTAGGPAFGTEHFKQYDFLHEKEVVLTYDDGPWPENTPMVLKALQQDCIKATFFEIGEHATWRPDLTRALVSAGMTVGSHTWSHKDLAKNPYARDIAQAEQEIEMGVSAVQMAAAGGRIAPFFRFPDLQQPPQLITYLGTRNIAIFSADIDTFDFKLRKPEEVVKSAMTKLAKNGKGIILMHDFQHATAEAMPELIA
jgi:peptidoglycan/xylan/chitin deacetylase (PgdA/CDA1 family)